MPESLNKQEKTSTVADPEKIDLEAEEKEANFLKHPENILSTVCAALSTQGLWHILIVPISTYLSFFIIILITFFLFRPANTSLQNTNQTNQSLTDEQKNKYQKK